MLGRRAQPVPVPKQGLSATTMLAIVCVLAVLGAILVLSWSGAFDHAQLPALPSRGSVGLPGSLPPLPTAPPAPAGAAQAPPSGQSGASATMTGWYMTGAVVFAIGCALLLLLNGALHATHVVRGAARTWAVSIAIGMGIGIPGSALLLIWVLSLLGLLRQHIQAAFSSLLGGG